MVDKSQVSRRVDGSAYPEPKANRTYVQGTNKRERGTQEHEQGGEEGGKASSWQAHASWTVTCQQPTLISFNPKTEPRIFTGLNLSKPLPRWAFCKALEKNTCSVVVQVRGRSSFWQPCLLWRLYTTDMVLPRCFSGKTRKVSSWTVFTGISSSSSRSVCVCVVVGAAVGARSAFPGFLASCLESARYLLFKSWDSLLVARLLVLHQARFWAFVIFASTLVPFSLSLPTRSSWNLAL